MPSFKQSQTFFNMNFVRNGPITLEWYAFYCGDAPKFNACHKTDAETIFRQYQINIIMCKPFNFSLSDQHKLCQKLFHNQNNHKHNWNQWFIFWMWNFQSKIKLSKSAKIEWFVGRSFNSKKWLWCFVTNKFF